MADEMVRKLLSEQRKRLVGSLMGAAERSEWWSALSHEEQRAYRQKVLDSVGVYHDLVLDLVKIGDDDGYLRNQHTVQMISELHALGRRLESQLSSRGG